MPPDPFMVQPPSAEVARLRTYYARVEADLRSRGMLRTETDPADAPFTARKLARDFEEIAFFNEYTADGGGFLDQRSPTTLSRWEDPIRMRLTFSPTATAADQNRDRADVTALAKRVSEISGIPIRMTEGSANYHILVLNHDDRQSAAGWLPDLLPDLPPSIVNEVVNSPQDIFCAAYSISRENAPGVLTGAVLLIKDEQPPLLRLSCIHEEIVQSMGLSNDSPTARPSLFNDDEEFALMTRHDELLLQMLYDPALEPGMSLNEARPIVRQLAEDVLDQGES